MKRSVGSALLVVALAAWVTVTGCGSSNAVRSLGDAELTAMNTVDERLAANQSAMEDAITTLGEMGADYAERAHVLERTLAQAKQLDALQSAWSTPPSDVAQARRAVILYHLYEVETAQAAALASHVAERREATNELNDQYGQLAAILGDATMNMELLLEYLNQPAQARIRGYASTFLQEAVAFREELETSDSPRLQGLAEQIARQEDAVLDAKDRLNAALDALLRED